MMDDKPWQIKRDTHPTVTLFWIASSVERGRPVTLYELNCIFCKRTIASDFTGDITQIINTPMDVKDLEMSATVVCKMCGQHYRLSVAKRSLG